MPFAINTNVASLQAQNYLRVTSNFQAKTIARVTSGLRIVNSGDDAAGLAIANGYRSDEAVLTQGVRNANDGLEPVADCRWRHQQHFSASGSRPHAGDAVLFRRLHGRPNRVELGIPERDRRN